MARIRLARSLPRILAAPLLLAIGGIGLAGGGLLLLGGVPGLVAAGAGALLVLVSLLLAAAPLSVRVQVEESLVRVSWLFGRRTYLLTPGTLTRVRLRGPDAARLRARFGVGWALWGATLHGSEEIHVVRLASTPSVILIPTARGRLAIASRDEAQLIEALTSAARARASRAEADEREAVEATAASPQPADVPAPPVPGPVPWPEADRPSSGAAPSAPPAAELTGIGRAAYEARLAQERAAAAAAASAPPIPATPVSRAVAPQTDTQPPAPPVPLVEAQTGPPPTSAPSWAQRRPSLPSVSLPSVSAPAIPGRLRALPIGRPQPSWLLLLLPLLSAGGALALGASFGELPDPGSDSARLTWLALVLAGPATTIGAIMARTWWPRIVGVVVTGGLASSVFVGRALLPI